MDFYQDLAGREMFLRAAADGKDILDFYRDPAAQALFKLHMWTLLTRVNSLTGIAYRDEPAIMAWNIMNEPRCPGECSHYHSCSTVVTCVVVKHTHACSQHS